MKRIQIIGVAFWILFYGMRDPQKALNILAITLREKGYDGTN